VYEKNSLKPSKLVTLDESNPYFQMIHQLWGEKLRAAFNSIAEPSWSGAQKSSAISAPAKKMVPVPVHHRPPKPKRAQSSAKTSKPAKKALSKKKA
jgi:putative proteasome-type protease